jgi:predicted DNA-binding transcriptional regulator AlpA
MKTNPSGASGPARMAYRIHEVVKMTGIGRTRLYACIKNGDLKARKLGRSTFVMADDLAAFLSSFNPCAL